MALQEVSKGFCAFQRRFKGIQGGFKRVSIGGLWSDSEGLRSVGSLRGILGDPKGFHEGTWRSQRHFRRILVRFRELRGVAVTPRGFRQHK